MKRNLIFLVAGLMALALTSCRNEGKETTVEIAWDTLTYNHLIADQYEAGISYDINVVLPKEGLNEAYTAIRHQLLTQLFAMPMSYGECDSIKLDLNDAQACLKAYLDANQKCLDDILASFKEDGLEAPPYDIHWECNNTLKPVMVNDTLITFLLNYANYAGGAHGIHGAVYMTFDTQTGEQLHDKDIFLKGTDEQLNHLLQNSLMHYCEKFEEQALTTADFEIDMLHINDNFYLTPDSIYYTYNVYEIAPYAYGSHTFGFSAKEALPYLNKESLAYKYWNLK